MQAFFGGDCMTMEQYLGEHGANEGAYVDDYHVCDYCGDEVDHSGRHWANGDVWVHQECMMEWLEDNLGAEILAKAVGFQRIVIGGAA